MSSAIKKLVDLISNLKEYFLIGIILFNYDYDGFTVKKYNCSFDITTNVSLLK